MVPTSSLSNIQDLEGVVERVHGFAEVYPEHKYRTVEVLQSKGHIVGMTGDGVNDTSALQKADVGIAVSDATAAAKSADRGRRDTTPGYLDHGLWDPAPSDGVAAGLLCLGYCLVVFFVIDCLKVELYRLLDHGDIRED